jgi:hypothetical protein
MGEEEKMILGIDPGKDGALVWLGEDEAEAMFFPIKNHTEADLAFLIRSKAVITDCAFIEKLGPHPTNGSISNFKLGMSYGFLHGMLAGICRYEEVTAIRWQTALGCRPKARTKHHEKKKITKGKAQEKYPQYMSKITHSTADALLIAEYGRRWYQKYGNQKKYFSFDLG